MSRDVNCLRSPIFWPKPYAENDVIIQAYALRIDSGNITDVILINTVDNRPHPEKFIKFNSVFDDQITDGTTYSVNIPQGVNRNNKIDTIYLSDLVMDYKLKKSLDSEFPMPKELAEVVLIMIDKMLGSPSWRGYTPDWKEEFRGRAIEHVLKYGHNFSPEKCKNGKNVLISSESLEKK